MTISNPSMATNALIYLQTPIPSFAIFKPKMAIFTDTARFCWVITGHFYGPVKFCWHSIFYWLSVFLLKQLISMTCLNFFVDITYFCWVITMYLCWLIKFCWHSIFCWISWFLLRQQIFAYSAIFCWVIIRHFDNSESFLLTQRIFGDPSIFADTAHDTA